MRICFLMCGLLVFAASVVSAAPANTPRDVPPGHWAVGAVHRVMAEGLMTGEPNGDFDGNKPVTRYELAVVLDRFVRDMEQARKPLSAAPAAALKRLVGSGFLPVNSPLLQAPGTKVVTAAQLADALADVTIRLSDRSLPPHKQ